jgi:hypothetical protein
MSSPALTGLAVPQPSSRQAAGWIGGWAAHLLALSANEYDKATKFFMCYDAVWDTDSSEAGGGYDVFGEGTAKLLLTRNKADYNWDGSVSAGDIGAFAGAYLSTTDGPSGRYRSDADFNNDGSVNAGDIGGFAGRYGTDCSFGD